MLKIIKKAVAQYLSGLADIDNEGWISSLDGWDNPVKVKIISSHSYLVRDYYKNGKVWSEERWENGELNGPSRVWDKRGRLTNVHFFKEGCLYETKSY